MLIAKPLMVGANQLMLLIELLTFVMALWFAGKLLIRRGGWVAEFM